MKKNFYVGALVSLMSIPMVVNAAGVSTVKFEGNTNVNVGDEFNVNMVIDNVEGTNGGVVAFGGYINYDKNVLELVNTNQADNKYEVLINRNINKIAALDYTLANGIKERTNVYTLTFKAIGEGNSEVTLNDGEVVDTNSEVNFNVEALNVTSKNIVVEDKENTYEDNYVETKVVEEIKEDKVENIKNVINKFFNRG
ncbi:MAG: hypothetical protein J6O56_03560 [Bacilli bacterium]|nr:hypothetical protein [Bacilli bacterium]